MEPSVYLIDESGCRQVSQPRGTYKDAEVCYVDQTLTFSQKTAGITAIRLVWSAAFDEDTLFLGDVWERGYSDMGWKKLEETGKMPWYFLAYSQASGKTRGFGVRTQPNALIYWTVSRDQVTMTEDIRSGSRPALLNGRRLTVCQVVMSDFEGDSFEAASAFCSQMCDHPRLPKRPIYGGNDWYCNYGDSSYEKLAQLTKDIVEVSPKDPKPYVVVDDGWQLCHHLTDKEEESFNGGPWIEGNRNFGSMKKMADTISSLGAIPAIWFRPLFTVQKVSEDMLLRHQGLKYTLDPSVPAVIDLVREDVRRFKDWGYQLIKHDFTSFDIIGKWGREQDAYLDDLPVFHDRTRTTAEIIKDLYAAIRQEAGEDTVIIGCNTMGHLAAGFFESQRTGDDTSGVEWSRTRDYGVNTMAFRMPQQGRFYLCDADCVGITGKIDWKTNRKWLDLAAKSGTALFVSIGRGTMTDQMRADLKRAFAQAASNTQPSVPLDWLHQKTPCTWQSAFGTDTYNWNEE